MTLGICKVHLHNYISVPVVSAAVCSTCKSVVLLLLDRCLLLRNLFCGEFVFGTCFVVLSVVSSFVIISLGKGELATLL